MFRLVANIWFQVKLLFVLYGLLIGSFNTHSISVNQVNFDQTHHTGISGTYTYDEIERSVSAEVNLSAGLSRVLSVKEVRPDCKVLALVARVAARTSTQGGLNLFKWGAPQTTKATGWKAGNYMLHFPNKGTPALNWSGNALVEPV